MSEQISLSAPIKMELGQFKERENDFVLAFSPPPTEEQQWEMIGSAPLPLFSVISEETFETQEPNPHAYLHLFITGEDRESAARLFAERCAKKIGGILLTEESATPRRTRIVEIQSPAEMFGRKPLNTES